MLSKQQLELVARKAVLTIGECEDNICLGHCREISEEIALQLRGRGIDSMVKEVSVGGGFLNHFAVVLIDHNLVIDTQVWQYVERLPVGLDKRVVVFGLRDYKSKGFDIKW